jgi:hypothetical protein
MDFDTIPGFTGGPDGGPDRSDWLKASTWDEKRLANHGADMSDPAARIVDAKMAAIVAAEQVSLLLHVSQLRKNIDPIGCFISVPGMAGCGLRCASSSGTIMEPGVEYNRIGVWNRWQ